MYITKSHCSINHSPQLRTKVIQPSHPQRLHTTLVPNTHHSTLTFLSRPLPLLSLSPTLLRQPPLPSPPEPQFKPSTPLPPPSASLRSLILATPSSSPPSERTPSSSTRNSSLEYVPIPRELGFLFPRPRRRAAGLAAALGPGGGRRVLCPVPLVVGLEEPPVVLAFLQELRTFGWAPTRVEAYETRWGGPRCAEAIVKGSEDGRMDALVFTSSAEVEGLLKSLSEFGLSFEEVKRRCPGLFVAAHGPVTAAGAERLGVKVDVVSSKFGSFDGVVDVLYVTFQMFRDGRIEL
ncbi:hypothetical protein PIB30_053910 [Stylosanthes scabra]|uniref:Tetrapyrrole biosynthesis uroporphyrinogen III synthase domain-containing protein n=1 Tax=Stylosanthes scabra TaxID=79078 RepID=A0ABU6YHF4_9FABA|nr:hypothetical protein [Stylosanthes scabra]